MNKIEYSTRDRLIKLIASTKVEELPYLSHEKCCHIHLRSTILQAFVPNLSLFKRGTFYEEHRWCQYEIYE